MAILQRRNIKLFYNSPEEDLEMSYWEENRERGKISEEGTINDSEE